MSDANKATLEAANAAITRGDTEGFLSHCTDDIVWTTIGKETIEGKDALRRWMKEAYAEPPEFTLTTLIAEGDYLTALGEITTKSDDGRSVRNLYSDVWRFRDGKMAELQAFVIEAA